MASVTVQIKLPRGHWSWSRSKKNENKHFWPWCTLSRFSFTGRLACKTLKLTAIRLVFVTLQKKWPRGHWSWSQSKKKHENRHFWDWCTLSFFPFPVGLLVKGLKLTAIRVVCVTLQKKWPTSHWSWSRSKKRWKGRWFSWFFAPWPRPMTSGSLFLKGDANHYDCD